MLHLLALISVAHAADVDFFIPASSMAIGRGGVSTEASQLAGDGYTSALVYSYGSSLVLREFADGGELREVRGATQLSLTGGYTMNQKVRFDMGLPIYTMVDAPITDFRGAAFGDLRLQATVPVYEVDDVTISVVTRVELPIGTRRSLTRSGLSAAWFAAIGGDLGRRFGWSSNFGPRFLKNDTLEENTRPLGSSFTANLAGWTTVGSSMRFGVEHASELGLLSNEVGRNNVGTFSGFASVVTKSGLGLTLAVGTGTTGGVGTPGERATFALSYAPSKGGDADGDGLSDSIDQCPADAEDFDQFEDEDGCPDVDNDRDTVLDESDECPLIPEDLDGFMDLDGCPDVDVDGDGVLDGDDECVRVAGLAEFAGCPDADGDGVPEPTDVCPGVPGTVAALGCPDRDGDGVPDDRDKCPDEPKPENEDAATSDGCPKVAYITDTEIKILERVAFETGKAEIKATSAPLLQAVADLLKSTSRIKRLEVQGHTDNVGSDSYNLKLSQERADSVRRWLLDHGVPIYRLSAVGYGETQPRDSNRTESGRQNNRRVQFQIIEQVEAEGK